MRFLKDVKAGVAPLLALSLIPIMGSVGAAVDYSRANLARSAMQGALDATALMLAKDAQSLLGDQGQVGKTSGNVLCNVDLWLSQNGEFVANSNTRASVHTVNDTIVLVSQAIMPLNQNDTINTIMSVSAPGQGCGLINTSSPTEPNIPAIIFSIVRIGN